MTKLQKVENVVESPIVDAVAEAIDSVEAPSFVEPTEEDRKALRNLFSGKDEKAAIRIAKRWLTAHEKAVEQFSQGYLIAAKAAKLPTDEASVLKAFVDNQDNAVTYAHKLRIAELFTQAEPSDRDRIEAMTAPETPKELAEQILALQNAFAAQVPADLRNKVTLTWTISADGSIIHTAKLGRSKRSGSKRTGNGRHLPPGSTWTFEVYGLDCSVTTDNEGNVFVVAGDNDGTYPNEVVTMSKVVNKWVKEVGGITSGTQRNVHELDIDGPDFDPVDSETFAKLCNGEDLEVGEDG